MEVKNKYIHTYNVDYISTFQQYLDNFTRYMGYKLLPHPFYCFILIINIIMVLDILQDLLSIRCCFSCSCSCSYLFCSCSCSSSLSACITNQCY